jgi:hypothetical protein
MDTEGLANLIVALNEPCCCESGTCDRQSQRDHWRDCEPSINRWWNDFAPALQDDAVRSHRTSSAIQVRRIA